MEQRLESLEKLVLSIADDIKATRETLAEVLRKTEDNFTTIHEKIDALTGDTSKSFKKVDFTLASIKDEISKINDVTHYEAEINNLKAIKGGKI